jgi:hypothetical protein
MRNLEDERNHERKLAEQRIIRLELDRFNKMKIDQRANEVKQALELDLKIVNEFFKMDQADRENKNRRRVELRREMQLYREHLMEQAAIEAENEKESEKMQQQEAERVIINFLHYVK